jgi:hypothetical protein
MNEFDKFKEQFIKWSIEKAEPIRENMLPGCPYAKSARKTNNLQFIDGRNDMMSAMLSYSNTIEMGIVWLGNDIDYEIAARTVKQISIEDRENIYFLSTANSGSIEPGFTNLVIIHKMDNYLIKQRMLYEQQYYDQYPADSKMKNLVINRYQNVYPIKRQRNQTMGSESQYQIFNHYCNTPGSVLDVGGSAGNLLHYNIKNITDYTCVDVSIDSIILGKEMYPNFEFVHFDRLNYLYNRLGDPFAEFPKIKKHDYVFINSVFTSTDLKDMIYILEQAFKVANKKIVFSVFSNKNEKVLNSFYEKFQQREITKSELYPNKTIDIRKWINYSNKICYLINNDQELFDVEDLQLENTCTSFVSMHNIEYLKLLLEHHFTCKVVVDDPCPIDNNFTVISMEKQNV